jgi:phytoene synthase
VSDPTTVLPDDLAALLPDKARTFSFAARFLPREQRRQVVVLYAFCRLMDDLVDDPEPGANLLSIRSRLAAWRDWLGDDAAGATPPEPVVLATSLRALIDERQLPPVYLRGLLRGLESDLDPVAIADFAALRRYCFLVAGTVGLAMAHLLGARRPEALVAAAELGIAMQLTNILRDLGSDLRAGRCYLPADELATFGYPIDRLAARANDGQRDEAFRALMRFQIGRARQHYERGLAGIPLLPAEARPAIMIAGRLYRAILEAIESNDYDVFRRRAATTTCTKLRVGISALVQLRFSAGRMRTSAPAPRSDSLTELTAWLA